MSDSNTQLRADFTEGSITGSIFKMGLPSMFGFLTINIYHLIDTWWVSRLPSGEQGVAALTFFGAIIMVLFSFNQLVGPGSVAIISRRYGEKNYDLVEKAIKETFILKLFFGFLFGVTGYVFAEELIGLVGAEGQTLSFGVDYGRVMFLWLGIPYATYSVFTAMRGIANPNMSMYLMFGSASLNMALDPLFMFGYLGFPELGIKGAAVASVASYSITLLVGLLLLYSGRTNVRLHLRGKVPISITSMWTIVKIGLPAWGGSIAFSGSRTLLTPIVATFGASTVAAFGLARQVAEFGIMIIVGIGLGLSTLIGHNLGGEKSERARQTGNQAILLSIVIMTLFGALAAIFAEFIMKAYFDSPETIAEGVVILRITALALPAIGTYIMIEEIHMGVGLNAPLMVFTSIHGWGLQLLPVYIAVVHLGYSALSVWWIMTASMFISATAVYIYYRRGRWLTVRV